MFALVFNTIEKWSPFLWNMDFLRDCISFISPPKNLIKSSASMISDFVESTELAIKDLREDFDFVKSVFYIFHILHYRLLLMK